MDGVAGAGNVTPWLRCPFCTTRLPAWAKRAQWEHVDQAHRDDGPADIEWDELTDCEDVCVPNGCIGACGV